ncbi:hypothetical protein Uis4E_0381 [Bifidobacterium parmae]|uniref:Uncharacterized protein n=2 Tax=Bifidobacterium parmae TaxID=361854 RepID=A0A2N5J5P8_9BIFI|nr:hypothetical protein Uis4E_0381 [Bifidobacterium parmae]
MNDDRTMNGNAGDATAAPATGDIADVLPGFDQMDDDGRIAALRGLLDELKRELDAIGD